MLSIFVVEGTCADWQMVHVSIGVNPVSTVGCLVLGWAMVTVTHSLACLFTYFVESAGIMRVCFMRPTVWFALAITGYHQTFRSDMSLPAVCFFAALSQVVNPCLHLLVATVAVRTMLWPTQLPCSQRIHATCFGDRAGQQPVAQVTAGPESHEGATLPTTF